jgi:cell wall-associated NlpC family hydrolase
VKRKSISRRAFALSIVSLAGTAASAFLPTGALGESSASLQEKLDEAKAHLDELNQQLMDKGEELNESQYQLDQIEQQIADTEAQISDLQTQIEEKQAELDEARSDLAERISDDYKAGPIQFLSIILNSQTFDEFVSHVYYADKVNEAEADAIKRVTSLKSELEDQQSQLEDQQAQLEEQETSQQEIVDKISEEKAEIEQQQADQQAYVDSLDSQVQEALRQEEEAAAAAAKQAQEEAAAEAARNGGNYYTGGTTNTSGSSSSSALTDAQRNTIIATAYGCLGTPYLLGAENPGVAFDCSGLAKYAYGQAGVSLPHYSMAQMELCQPLQSVSSCQPGDLVFWTSPRHVAIYLGSSQIIEANYSGVRVCSIWGNCVGGGCPV